MKGDINKARCGRWQANTMRQVISRHKIPIAKYIKKQCEKAEELKSKIVYPSPIAGISDNIVSHLFSLFSIYFCDVVRAEKREEVDFSRCFTTASEMYKLSYFKNTGFLGR
jgi:hypothetical protein